MAATCCNPVGFVSHGSRIQNVAIFIGPSIGMQLICILIIRKILVCTASTAKEISGILWWNGILFCIIPCHHQGAFECENGAFTGQVSKALGARTTTLETKFAPGRYLQVLHLSLYTLNHVCVHDKYDQS